MHKWECKVLQFNCQKCHMKESKDIFGANTCNTLFSSTFKNAWKQVTLNEYTIYNKMKVVKNKKVKVKTNQTISHCVASSKL